MGAPKGGAGAQQARRGGRQQPGAEWPAAPAHLPAPPLLLLPPLAPSRCLAPTRPRASPLLRTSSCPPRSWRTSSAASTPSPRRCRCAALRPLVLRLQRSAVPPAAAAGATRGLSCMQHQAPACQSQPLTSPPPSRPRPPALPLPPPPPPPSRPPAALLHPHWPGGPRHDGVRPDRFRQDRRLLLPHHRQHPARRWVPPCWLLPCIVKVLLWANFECWVVQFALHASCALVGAAQGCVHRLSGPFCPARPGLGLASSEASGCLQAGRRAALRSRPPRVADRRPSAAPGPPPPPPPPPLQPTSPLAAPARPSPRPWCCPPPASCPRRRGGRLGLLRAASRCAVLCCCRAALRCVLCCVGPPGVARRLFAGCLCPAAAAHASAPSVPSTDTDLRRVPQVLLPDGRAPGGSLRRRPPAAAAARAGARLRLLGGHPRPPD